LLLFADGTCTLLIFKPLTQILGGEDLDQRGVEPLAMKIFAGIVLLVIGLGIGYAVYSWAAGYATGLKCTITLASDSSTIARGENETIGVTVEYLMGTKDNVTLRASGHPPEVEISFKPATDEPTFFSDMVIIVTPAAEPGDYPLTISADDSRGNQTASARFDLTVV
jgi:hypothetical protein